ncbi:universal stress protein [Oceanobacillus sp. CAU 1775]
MGRNILVAYDGSELSKQAIIEAKRQTAVGKEGIIYIATVVTPGISSNNTAVAGNLSMKDTELIFPELESVKNELVAEGYLVHSEILTDFSQKNPGVAICDFAEEKDIDLIIVGNRGLSNLRKMILGSVSNAIVQRASCKVLVIK